MNAKVFSEVLLEFKVRSRACATQCGQKPAPLGHSIPTDTVEEPAKKPVEPGISLKSRCLRVFLTRSKSQGLCARLPIQGCWNRLRLGMSEKARSSEQRSSKTFMPQ